MLKYTPVLLVFALGTSALPLCPNVTTVDEGDPQSIKLAQLQYVQCQTVMLSEIRKTLDGLQVDGRTWQTANTVSEYLLTSFLSILSFWTLCQIAAALKYTVIQTSDRVVRLILIGHRLMRFQLSDPTDQDVQDYRSQLSPPLIICCCKCCCMTLTA